MAYKNFGKLVCSSVVLVGIGSAFVFAEESAWSVVKDSLARSSQKNLEAIEDIEAFRNGLEYFLKAGNTYIKNTVNDTNKQIVFIYILVALKVLTIATGVLLTIRLIYLKDEENKTKAIDKAWDNAGFGLTYIGEGKTQIDKFNLLKNEESKVSFLKKLNTENKQLLETVIRHNLEKNYKVIMKEKKFRYGDGSLMPVKAIEQMLSHEEKQIEKESKELKENMKKCCDGLSRNIKKTVNQVNKKKEDLDIEYENLRAKGGLLDEWYKSTKEKTKNIKNTYKESKKEYLNLDKEYAKLKYKKKQIKKLKNVFEDTKNFVNVLNKLEEELKKDDNGYVNERIAFNTSIENNKAEEKKRELIKLRSLNLRKIKKSHKAEENSLKNKLLKLEDGESFFEAMGYKSLTLS